MNLFPSLARMRQFAPLALILFSAAVAVAAYMQAFDYPFFSDDRDYVTNNAKLAGLHWAELWRLFAEPYNFFEFLPLRDLSYWFDIKLFGLNPSAFRMHNILLYLLCLPLVYGATLSWWHYFRPADAASTPWAAAAVTALFALHPAHVEAVVWVSGRKDLLAGIFSMLALWLAMSAKRGHGLSAPHAASAMIAFVAVMLSKASYVAVAPVIALLWLIFWRNIPLSNRRRIQLLWPLAILLLAAFLTQIFTAISNVKTPVYFDAETVTQSLAVLGRLTNIAITLGGRHFIYPVIEHPYFPSMVAIGVATLVAAATGGWMALRRRSLEGFVLVAFLLLCMPYMQLIPFRTFALVQDRYVALAVWPAMLLVVALSWRLKPLPRTVLLLALALPWGFQTVERPREWRSVEVMTDVDLRAYPGHYGLAVQKIAYAQLPKKLYREAGETANGITDPEIRNIMLGLIKADYAVRTDAVDTGNPRNAMALLLESGLILKQQPVQLKRDAPRWYIWVYCTDALSAQWNYLAEHFPDDVAVRYNAGLWMLNVHNNNAATHLRAAAESQHLPESVRGTAFKNLGLALINNGQIAEAEAPLRTALDQSPPDLRAYCLLSEVYKQTRRIEEAARAETGCLKQAQSEGMAQ